MAKVIHSSVGTMGSANMLADVRIVQELLNRVPRYEGGPEEPLVVDGRCGPILIAAIRKFQSEQFFQLLEDGKVQPGKQTITRLNQYSGSPALTGASRICCPHGGMVTAKALTIVPGLDPSEAPLTTTDHFQIAGCPTKSPCVKVKWVVASGKLLDAQSTGVCLSAANVPQGPAIIQSV